MRRSQILSLATPAGLLVASDAQAHIKWFAPYDLTEVPTPPTLFAEEPAWLAGLFLSVAVIFGCAMLDRLLPRAAALAARLDGCGRLRIDPDLLVRLSLGLWLSWLCLLPGPVYLTPELHADRAGIQLLQGALALCCLSRGLCWVAGAGIAAIWVLAAGTYGVFHLLDYPVFLGFSAYLAAISLHRGGVAPAGLGWLVRHRQAVLGAALALTLGWGSMEKWSYTQWSLPLLNERPYLTMGFAPRVFMSLAGWFEWGAAFLLVFGGMPTRRLAALALLIVMAGAVADFGRIDLVGHFPIMVGLLLIAGSGTGDGGRAATRPAARPWLAASGIVACHSVLVALVAGAYFLSWDLAYGALICVDPGAGTWVPGTLALAAVALAATLLRARMLRASGAGGISRPAGVESAAFDRPAAGVDQAHVADAVR